mmetsp:Transcript_42034/g.137120  ORF Transcript_42034/g.137120 Transcript_42034/m.137120 type:complete len:448 (+) Transcript_42034:29-1372(+)
MGERALPTGMLAAARDGDVECLLTFLDDGVSANAGNVIGQTAMHIASIWGHVDVVDALLDAGANPNQENDDGLPPLYFAVRNNRLSVVRLLLDRGAVIRDLDRLLKVSEEEVAAVLMRSGPRNELTQAIKALDLDKLKELLDAGKILENESWKDARGRTPLHYASFATVAIADERADQGEADPYGASDGLSALELVVQAVAASGGEAAVCEACDELDDRGISPLHSLVQAGHVRAAGMLLRAGADANVQSAPASDEYTSGQWGKLNAEGEMEVLRAGLDVTPLHLALDTEEPSTPMVELLLSHRADPNLRDQQGRSALHLALDFEEERGGIDLALCEKLLAHGADPSLGSSEIGMANGCIHAAAAASEVGVVRLLLRHGASHSAPGKGGWTPLAIAARAGSAGVVEALLAAGADPDAVSPSGKSARELATINKKAKVIAAIEAHACS